MTRCPFCQLECKTKQDLWKHILGDPECDRWIVMAKTAFEKSVAADIAKIWINKEKA